MLEPRSRVRTTVLVAIGMLLGVSLAACKGSGPKYVQFTNGFDFPVKANVTDSSGEETTFEIPAKGRIGADLEGKCTIELTTPDGKTMENKKYEFAASDKRKERCHEYVNVLGSAAIIEEDIVYGMGIRGGGKLLCGQRHVKVCPRWGFETTQPPKAITVKEGTVGMIRTWLHYTSRAYASSVSTASSGPT